MLLIDHTYGDERIMSVPWREIGNNPDGSDLPTNNASPSSGRSEFERSLYAQPGYESPDAQIRREREERRVQPGYDAIMDRIRREREEIRAQPGCESPGDRIIRELEARGAQPGYESPDAQIRREREERRAQPGYDAIMDRIRREKEEIRAQPGYESLGDRIIRELEARRASTSNREIRADRIGHEAYNEELVEFATQVLMSDGDDPNSLRNESHEGIRGPQTDNDHEMVAVILGKRAGYEYPRYRYFHEDPTLKDRYQKLEIWSDEAFKKWRQKKQEV
ncbi:hypothetical protein ccbrp13_04750 [Ktedonobacteria bacterium brp13]|nr:hypothetical protein ccbrp13_04750 [Ktedonobacteria bacterium brp13]